MAILAGKSRASLRGSYFDILAEKYPDLAKPEASVGVEASGDASSRAKPNAVSVSPPPPRTDGPDAPVSAVDQSSAFDSAWLPAILLLLLALALIFPPALLWSPPWRSSEVASGAEEAVLSHPVEVQLPQPESGAAPPSVVVLTERPTATISDSAREPVSPAPLPEVDAAMADAGVADTAMADVGVADMASLSVAPVATTPRLAQPDLDAGGPEPASLTLATAGPRIEAARRLSGDTPSLSSPASARRPTRVRLRTHIDAGGNVVGVDVVQGASETLDRQLASALRRWRYAPATVDGRAVPSQQEVVFVLPLAGQPVQLAENEPIEPARRRVSPLPAYTEEAWVQGTQGDVELLASIDARGKVTEVEVLQGLPHGLTQAAVHAVQGWKFEPARQRGQAVPSTQRLLLRFAF